MVCGGSCPPSSPRARPLLTPHAASTTTPVHQERLCTAITGKEWYGDDQLAEQFEDNPDMFAKEEQLASYLAAQLGPLPMELIKLPKLM